MDQQLLRDIHELLRDLTDEGVLDGTSIHPDRINDVCDRVQAALREC